jgi:tRNA-dihydrouridine synthase 4
MEKRELVRDMVVETREQLRRDGWAVNKEKDMDSPKGRSVSVKIRVHKDLRYVDPPLRGKRKPQLTTPSKTIDFITTVLGPDQDRHIDWLTIHPRTRSTPSSTPINLEALELLTSTFGTRVPILLSGDVFALDALPFTTPLLPTFTTTTTTTTTPQKQQNKHLPNLTGLTGLMTARALLSNPALHAGHGTCPWAAVDTFLNNVARCPLPYKLVQHHVGEMCAPGMGPDKTALLTKAQRAGVMACGNMVELVDFLDGVREREGGVRRDG